ncbi:2633_t:CDS:2 [Ambispora leptoticha]|uniref:2633_t:CDS:1 n=1 Tax=Ambispora leptoticha TaxID=144679 RepID=A0A9N8ZRZ9_9GLOM|nr:2633_t:CDS:2 [Ambispora leptoticha]
MKFRLSSFLLPWCFAATVLSDDNSKKLDKKIRNVVLIVLENRSFSKMAGYFNYSKEIRGLTGKEYNLLDVNDSNSLKLYTTDDAVYVDPDDPSHSIPGTYEQITGMQGDPSTPITGVPPMSGFLQNFARVYNINKTDVARLKHVMNAFKPTDIPVTYELAKNFALFDGWYASVPGPTNPNRLYIHTATSNGAYETTNHDELIGFDQRSIYDNLDEKNITWKNYYSTFPELIAAKRLRNKSGYSKMKKLDVFFADAKAGTLPQYSVVNPTFEGYPCFNGEPNDEHPPYSVAKGEQFIKTIYEALRASPQWNSSLLIITWDEHGGFYDNVPPPSNVPPPDNVTAPIFNFDRLGIRVPTLLISPWIKKGLVVHDPPKKGSYFEHSSIPATLKKIFDLPNFLTRRDAWAGTFEYLWEDVEFPRTDTPTTLPDVPKSINKKRKHRRSQIDLPEPVACLLLKACSMHCLGKQMPEVWRGFGAFKDSNNILRFNYISDHTLNDSEMSILINAFYFMV